MNQNLHRVGWLVAAIMGGILLGSGFQEAGTKIGVVDITSVIEQSKFGKDGQAEFAAMKSAREGLLEYANNSRIMTIEQSTRVKDLTLKINRTAEETAELERIKADVQSAEKRNKELITKQSLTPEERTLMEEYAKRAASMETVANRWYQDFMGELQVWADKRKVDSLNKARVAIQDTAKAQGFTVVFEVGVAPYGANNLTDAALKAMDSKN